MAYYISIIATLHPLNFVRATTIATAVITLDTFINMIVGQVAHFRGFYSYLHQIKSPSQESYISCYQDLKSDEEEVSLCMDFHLYFDSQLCLLSFG